MAVEVEAGAYLNQLHMGRVVVFSHNPLHDLESLWWVGVWFLLCHYRPNNVGDNSVQHHVKVVKKFGATLFNKGDFSSRRCALIGSALLDKLNMFRGHLLTYYKSYEPKESQDRSFFVPHVHRKFGVVFEDAVQKLRNDQTKLWPLDDIEERITYLVTCKFF